MVTNTITVNRVWPDAGVAKLTQTSLDLETEMFKRAMSRCSNVAEPIDLLMAIAFQGHGAGGAILKNLIREINDPLAKTSPFDYLKRKIQPASNGRSLTGDEISVSARVRGIFELAESISAGRKHEKIESIDFLIALFELADDHPTIQPLGISRKTVDEAVLKYLTEREKNKLL